MGDLITDKSHVHWFAQVLQDIKAQKHENRNDGQVLPGGKPGNEQESCPCQEREVDGGRQVFKAMTKNLSEK
jgi:hypothetical protein